MRACARTPRFRSTGSPGPQLRLGIPDASLIAITLLHASGQDSRLSIKAPTETTYVAGEVLLVAAVEPAAAERDVEEVTFFAGGTKVCEVTSPPFECHGMPENASGQANPGRRDDENGGRLVQTVTNEEAREVRRKRGRGRRPA